VRRVALTLAREQVEPALDVLMPRLPGGVYERPLDDERTEVVFYVHARDAPDRSELEALPLLGLAEEEVPDDLRERRRRAGRSWEVPGRFRVRSPDDPPGSGDLPEIVLEPAAGAFGTGAHPTTRMCLEILVQIPPAGPFADLGCGAGVLAIAAAVRGWDPVFAVDFDPRSVEATRRNAARNGVVVSVAEADLAEIPPPPATLLAANVPLAVHEQLAARLPDAVDGVLVSGIVRDQAEPARERYEAAGFTERIRDDVGGWSALLMTRS
jgi:ribosomal protein L11 methyltransferase